MFDTKKILLLEKCSRVQNRCLREGTQVSSFEYIVHGVKKKGLQKILDVVVYILFIPENTKVDGVIYV
jgi:hypothetical protein